MSVHRRNRHQVFAEVLPRYAEPDGREYVKRLFAEQRFEDARVIEEIAKGTDDGCDGVRFYQKGMPWVTEAFQQIHAGVVGIADRYVSRKENDDRRLVAAINPLLREVVLESMVTEKAKRVAPLVQAIRKVLVSMSIEDAANALYTEVNVAPDFALLRYQLYGEQDLYVHAGVWIADKDAEALASPPSASLLIVLTDQTLPSIDNTLKLRRDCPTYVAVISSGVLVESEIREPKHPLVSRIVEHLMAALPESQSSGIEPPAPLALGEKINIPAPMVKWMVEAASAGKYRQITVPKKHRGFFPGYGSEFTLETDCGSFITRITGGGKHAKRDSLYAGNRISSENMSAWFGKHLSYGQSTWLTFMRLDDARYRLMTG